MMHSFKRIFVVVMDSVGIGEAPDAKEFNDVGADTLGHIAQHMNGIQLPNLEKLGLGNIREIDGVQKVDNPQAFDTKMQEASASKDTMTGHCEIMSLYIDQPFQTFPDGFPNRLIRQLEEKPGRKVIGNKPASGTEILKELGQKHIETGSLFVYTSADSVLQIAAHEDIIPINEQYKICEIYRGCTKEDDYHVSRGIDRTYIE